MELEKSEKRRIRHKILEKEGISARTLRRYLVAYRKGGYEGLEPKNRSDTGSLKRIPKGKSWTGQ
jgi:transposase